MAEPHSIQNVEQWKPVVGFEGFYEVSHIGRVRRIKADHGATPGKILKPGYNARHGYFLVSLYKDAVATKRAIHIIVAAAFLGPVPEGHEVNHKNCIKYDNRAENLEYVTRSQNIQHAHDNGLIEKTWRKITHEQVLEAIEMLAGGMTNVPIIAKSYGVNYKTLHQRIQEVKTGIKRSRQDRASR